MPGCVDIRPSYREELKKPENVCRGMPLCQLLLFVFLADESSFFNHFFSRGFA